MDSIPGNVSFIISVMAHVGGIWFLYYGVTVMWREYRMSAKLKQLLKKKIKKGMFKVLTYRMGTVTADVPYEFEAKDIMEAIKLAMQHDRAKPGGVFYGIDGNNVVAIGIIDWFNVKQSYLVNETEVNQRQMSKTSLDVLMLNKNLHKPQ